MPDELNVIAITRLSGELVEHLAGDPRDIGIKIAALQSAAAILTQAVAVASITAAIQNALRK